jgi:hypothetical protein
MPKKTAIANLRSKAGMPKIKQITKTGHHLMARDVSEPVYSMFHGLPHGARQAVMHSLFEVATATAKTDPLWYEKILRGEMKLAKKEPRVARS